jgi:hypothetical protein
MREVERRILHISIIYIHVYIPLPSIRRILACIYATYPVRLGSSIIRSDAAHLVSAAHLISTISPRRHGTRNRTRYQASSCSLHVSLRSFSHGYLQWAIVGQVGQGRVREGRTTPVPACMDRREFFTACGLLLLLLLLLLLITTHTAVRFLAGPGSPPS